MIESKVLSLKEIAAVLNVHKSTMYRMLRHKQIPAFKIGRGWRFNAESIERWVKDQEAVGGAIVTGEHK